MVIWFFTVPAAFMLFTGLEAAKNGHRALGGLLAICGLIAAITGASIEIIIAGKGLQIANG